MSSLLLAAGRPFSGRKGETSIRRWNSDMEDTDTALGGGGEETVSAACQPGCPPICMAQACRVPVATVTMRTLSSRSMPSSPELTLWMFNGLFVALELF